MNTIEQLTKQLKQDKFLTCSDLSLNREYIFLDNNDIIKVMKMGDIVMNFDIKLYEKSNFIPVERVFNNFDYMN